MNINHLDFKLIDAVSAGEEWAEDSEKPRYVVEIYIDGVEIAEIFRKIELPYCKAEGNPDKAGDYGHVPASWLYSDLSEATIEQIEFICKECDISQDELMQLDEDSLYDVVYEKMCDIEIAEVPADGAPISDHCIMASDIVTLLSNALAFSAGFYHEQLNDKDDVDNLPT